MRKLILLVGFLFFVQAHAEGAGDWFFLPSFGVGYNTVQGTNYRLGLDLGMWFDENIYAGVGGYYAAGSHPEADREIGAGPFVGYAYPLLRFLTVGVREDIDWVDQRDPFIVPGTNGTYSYTQNSGVLSYTYAGVHISFSRNFGISAGYRLAVGLSKSSLANGRSGTSLGLTIGI